MTSHAIVDAVSLINPVPVIGGTVVTVMGTYLSYILASDVYISHKSKKIYSQMYLTKTKPVYSQFAREVRDLWLETTMSKEKAACVVYEKWENEGRV